MKRGSRSNRNADDPRAGWYRDYDTSYEIGLTGRTVIRLVFNPDGTLKTAFPYL